LSREDWYRNDNWNEEIEVAFFAKLKRARRKEQYLRIQASIIASTYPDVALTLLERYFALKDDFDHAQAYCDMAKAHLSKGQIDQALSAYSKALSREYDFPKLKTDAYILYPITIIENKITELYYSANEVLDKNENRLMFPVDYFRWYAAKAIIEFQMGNIELAKNHAAKSLDAAKIKKSGFRFHQKLGIVGEKYSGIVNELRAIYA
jgi:tetratricopeptide (TPR) repeat protein